jgi:Zn-dependent peptidase ImmA (M78 family)/DNA-binding XRE family transcriptional regulator
MYELPTSLTIGRRIALAREEKRLNQEELARELGIASHQSISELEKGNRKIDADELARLSDILGRNVDYFIDPFGITGEACYSWRRSAGTAEAKVRQFESRMNSVVGLLRWLRMRDEESLSPLKKTLRLSTLSTLEEARSIGDRLAAGLKLGAVPADNLLSKIEGALDVPVLHVDVDLAQSGSISGAAVHLPNFTCILINRNEPAGRRAFDLAHELFHALTWDVLRPPELESDTVEAPSPAKKNRVEQMADSFASALLMPSAVIEPKFNRAKAGDIQDLLALASHFKVSPMALGWRLYALRLIDKALCERVIKYSSTDKGTERPKLYSTRFVQSLAEALAAGELSPRKAAKLLHCNLDDLEALIHEHGIDTPIEF